MKEHKSKSASGFWRIDYFLLYSEFHTVSGCYGTWQMKLNLWQNVSCIMIRKVESIRTKTREEQTHWSASALQIFCSFGTRHTSPAKLHVARALSYSLSPADGGVDLQPPDTMSPRLAEELPLFLQGEEKHNVNRADWWVTRTNLSVVGLWKVS